MSYNGSTRFIGTGVLIKPDEWNAKKQIVKNCEYSNQYNIIISDKIRKISTFVLNCHAAGKIPSTKEILSIFEKSPVVTFNDFCMDHLAYVEAKKSKSTFHQRRRFVAIMTDYNDRLLFENISYNFIISFEKWLLSQNSEIDKSVKLSRNYVSKMLDNLKYFCLQAMKEGCISENPFKGFKISTEKTFPTYLDNNELSLVETLDISKLNSSMIKYYDAFLFQCYTGLRFSDLHSLSSDKIIGASIQLSPIKTRHISNPKIVKLPIDVLFSGKPLSILEKYKPYGGNIFGISNKVNRYNVNIRKICKLAGIHKHVTSHVARHTFAMYLLNAGVELITVSNLLGHTSVVTTQIYAKMTAKGIRDDIRKAFT